MPALMMKAATIHEYGGPEVVRYGEVPVPRADRDKILVKVRAAGVNPAD